MINRSPARREYNGIKKVRLAITRDARAFHTRARKRLSNLSDAFFSADALLSRNTIFFLSFFLFSITLQPFPHSQCRFFPLLSRFARQQILFCYKILRTDFIYF